MREESGVRLQAEDIAGIGVLEWAPNVGEVVHRTPEELGLAREIPYKPVQPTWTRPWTDRGVGSMQRNRDRSRAARGMMQHNRDRSTEWNRRQHMLAVASERAQEATERVFEGVLVKMPAAAVIGAELLDGFIAEQKERVKVPVWNRVDEAKKAAIAADAKTMTYAELEAKYKVGHNTIWRVLRECGMKPAGSRIKKAIAGGAVRQRVKSERAEPQAQLVRVDPQANGTASALLGALDRLGKHEEYLSLSFAIPEVIEILNTLSDQKRRAFMAAGLKAALLAE